MRGTKDRITDDIILRIKVRDSLSYLGNTKITPLTRDIYSSIGGTEINLTNISNSLRTTTTGILL